MIIYNTTINVNENIVDEFVKWIKQEYIPQIIATDLFVDINLFEVLVEEEMGGITFSLQHSMKNMETYKEFNEKHFANFDKLMHDKFTDNYVTFSTILQKVE